MEELTYVDFEITKFDTQSDGTVIVRGPATTDDLDSDKQIIDAEFAARKLPQWLKSGGNIRAMHKADAVGGGMSLERQGNAQILTAHIIDSNAAKLATPHPVTGIRVLRAFSVGISGAKIVKDPKAPGGRIVDGEFVEVSLVDRPANSSCKVDLVSKMEDGSAHFTDILVKAEDEGEDCGTCKGTGKIMDGNRQCPDCGGSGKMEMSDETKAVEIAVYKKDYSDAERKEMADKGHALPDGSYPIGNSEDLHNAYVLAASGHGNVSGAKSLIARRAKELGVSNPFEGKDDDATKAGKIPPVDQDVTDELNQADEALHNAKDSQAKDNEMHESGDDDEDDDAEKFDAPYLVKRLHDHICAAFHPDAVKSAYPAVANFADVVDPNYWAQRVTEVIAEGTGDLAGAKKMNRAAQLYGLVVQLNKSDAEAVELARLELAKVFADSYPSIHLTPGDITPGQFKRPYISGGRANESAKPGQKPRLPMQASVPAAAQFDRHYMTDGRAAPSPMQGDPNTASMSKLDCTGTSTVTPEGVTILKITHTPTGISAQGATEEAAWANLQEVAKQRQFYTNNAKDQVMQTMEGIHDMIVGLHPGVCAMKPAEPAAKADDSVEEAPALDDAGSNVVDNRANAHPTATQGYTKALAEILGEGATVQKMINAESVLKALVDAEVEKMTQHHTEEIETLTKRLEDTEEARAELAKLADPEQGVFRGGRGAIQFLPKSAEETPQGTEDPAEVAKREKVEWLMDTIHSSTDQASIRKAIDVLEGLVTGDELAALLVKTG